MRAEDHIGLFLSRATLKMAISSFLKVMKSHYPLFLSSDITTQEFPWNSRWHVPLLKSLPLTNSVWLCLCKWEFFPCLWTFFTSPKQQQILKSSTDSFLFSALLFLWLKELWRDNRENSWILAINSGVYICLQYRPKLHSFKKSTDIKSSSICYLIEMCIFTVLLDNIMI